MKPKSMFLMLLLMIMGVVGVNAETITVSLNPETNGTFSIDANVSGYYKTWTSNATSGVAGLSITTSGNLGMCQKNVSNYGGNLLAFKTTSSNTLEEEGIHYPEANTAYKISNAYNRGSLFYAPGQSPLWVWSTGKGDATPSGDNDKWVFISTGNEHEYYIYNIGRKRYIEPISGGNYGQTWAFSPNPIACTLTAYENGNFSIRKTDGNVYMSVSNSYVGPIITYYSASDEGVPFILVKGDAISSDVQADIANASVKLITNDVGIKQGFHTTGRGNTDPLLCINICGFNNPVTISSLQATITGAANLDKISVYGTNGVEYFAETPTLLGETNAATNVSITLNKELHTGINYLWLTATIKNDATLEESIDAALTQIGYSLDGNSSSLDVSTIGNPDGAAKIFALQNFVFTPTTNNCQYYRIPAMIIDQNGDVVVAIDRRYNSNGDLGKHKIDVSVVRSSDAGRTWSSQNIVAVGNTSIEARYGYGDAALARTQSGKLICLMAAGQNNFFGTTHPDGKHFNNWVAMLTSDDNGVTWKGTDDNPTQPILLTSDVFGMGTNHSIFVSSGKGLTTAGGTVMFTTNVLMPNGTINCYILKTPDEGATWTLGNEVAYSGTDESKLEQLSDGRLILSVRQSGNRGWNFGNADGTGWGTQYRTSDIWGNACNADIINYGREMNLGMDVLIHSYINSSGRESLELAMSVDGGLSWHDVYNIQTKGSCYSTMQVLNDGTLAILFEDESFSAGNGYAINYLTVTKEQIETWVAPLLASINEQANDITYQQAMNEIVNGGKYYITTEYNGNIYWMGGGGYLQTSQDNAEAFTFRESTISGGYKAVAWELIQSTNAGRHFTNGESSNNGYIHWTTRTDVRNWERQVLFLNSTTGKYAIRSTNAPDGSGYQCNAYWMAHDYDGGEGSYVAAGYDLANIGTPHFIWNLVPVDEEDLNYNRALNELENGAIYQIKTTKDGVDYYMKEDGTLSATASDACNFVVGQAANANGYKPIGWRIFSPNFYYSFTNPANGVYGENSQLNRTQFTSNDRVSYDAQVLYFNGDKYAVRASNVIDGTWVGNMHWAVSDANQAVYLNDGTHYIWDFVKKADAPAFTTNQTYRIKSASTNYNFISTGSTSGATVTRSTDESIAAEFLITRDESKINGYYVYDIKSGLFLKSDGYNGSSGKDWTFTDERTSVVFSNNTMTNVSGLADASQTNYLLTNLITGQGRGLANTYGGGVSGQVKTYQYINDAGSNWLVLPTNNSVGSGFVGENQKPNNIYYIRNEGNNKFLAATPEAETNYAMVASESSDAAAIVIFPVKEQPGYYYMYNTANGNYLVPDNTNVHLNTSRWSWSTTPTSVQVRNNKENNYKVGALLYTFGTNRAANGEYSSVTSGDYVGNFQQSSPNLGLNHWYIVKAGEDVTVELNTINTTEDNISSIQSLVESGVDAGTQLQYTTNLNTVGNASWATLYVPFDLTLPDNFTTAYYVSGVDDNTANLVELSEIPHLTPVVIKNSDGATSVTFPVTTDLSVFEETNLLVGTNVAMPLDLGSETPYYSLGRLNGNIGFYKFKGTDGTTTITLGANKAYLKIPVPTSNNVRGFKIGFAGDDSLVSDDGGFADGINEVQTTDDNVIYDLNGLRVSTLRKGIYVVNGKKVVIK